MGKKMIAVRVINKMSKILFSVCVLISVLMVQETIYAATGWQQKDDGWYYYHNETMHKGWLEVNGRTYFLDEEGQMKTGWQKLDDSWFLFRADGTMHIGWWEEQGIWYYLTLDGTMLHDGYGPDGHWMNHDGSWNAAEQDTTRFVLFPERQKRYILNWETDTVSGLTGSGTCDMAIVFALRGLIDPSELMYQERPVYDVAKEFIDSEIEADDSEYEKVCKIAKFIWETAKYDDSASGGPYGLLIDGKAVCNGYARTFKLLANALGIECYKVNSNEHEWNLVRVDGEWYNISPTETLLGKTDKDLEGLLMTDAQYTYSKHKYQKYTPDCTATKYTK